MFFKSMGASVLLCVLAGCGGGGGAPPAVEVESGIQVVLGSKEESRIYTQDNVLDGYVNATITFPSRANYITVTFQGNIECSKATSGDMIAGCNFYIQSSKHPDVGKQPLDVKVEDESSNEVGHATKILKVFFDKQGSAFGVPNWYFYWDKTSDSGGITDDHEFLSTLTTGYGGFYAAGATKFKVGPLASGSSDRRSVGSVDGIDLFGIVVVHERAHLTYWKNTWGFGNATTPGPFEKPAECTQSIANKKPIQKGLDCDQDGLDDLDEYNSTVRGLDGNFDFQKTCTFLPASEQCIKDYYDSEEYAQWKELDWKVGSANCEDWANPGKQYPNSCP